MPRRNVAPIPRSAAARPLTNPAALAAFRPSPLQRRFMQMAIEGDEPLRVSAVCEELGMARSTYYRWLENDGFRAWMALQWASTLMADGGRLLSIARSRAETDFRYWKALVEIIFDPRGLGLLAAWQQRMGAVAETEPDSDELERDDDTTVESASACPRSSQSTGRNRAPDEADAPPAAPKATVASPAPVKSTTCAASMQQNASPAAPVETVAQAPREENPPAPYVPRLPPSWPNGGGRFHP